MQELRLQEDLYISFFYLFFILFISLIGIVINLIREQARSLFNTVFFLLTKTTSYKHYTL